MKGLHWDPEASVAANAAHGLPLLAGRFFEAGRSVAEPGSTARELHRFRIAAKRLRYTLEFFAGVYGPRLAELLGQLRQLQTILGERNDRAATLALLTPPEEHAAARELLEAQAARLERDFRHFWATHFGVEDNRERWLRYLKSYARGPSAGTN
jgi:CHAD domain-containing protein